MSDEYPSKAFNALVFEVNKRGDDKLSELACAIMNAPGMVTVMREHAPEKLYKSGVMLHDCEADTWASVIERATAYTWLRDALLYFCAEHPEQVQIGIDRINAGVDIHKIS